MRLLTVFAVAAWSTTALAQGTDDSTAGPQVAEAAQSPSAEQEEPPPSDEAMASDTGDREQPDPAAPPPPPPPPPPPSRPAVRRPAATPAPAAAAGAAGAPASAPSPTGPAAAPPVEEPAPEVTDPVFMHAEALEAELDNETDRALDTLRRAHKLVPDDETIAFDLARLSFESKSPKLKDDVGPFLAMDPSSPDAGLLRAYIHVAQGDTASAATYVGKVLQQRPEDSEALQLQAMVGGGPAAREQGATLSARVRTTGQYDSNVTVLPETIASSEAGVRASVDGTLFGTIPIGALKLELGGNFQLGTHLSNRKKLSAYDAGSAVVFVGTRFKSNTVVLAFELSDTNVFTDLVQTHFMHDVGARLEARFPVGPVQLGLYGRGGYRDFRADKGTDKIDIRDGPRAEGGPLLTWRQGQLSLRFHVGGQGEFAKGKNQRERGLVAALLCRWRPDPFALGVGVGYEYRDFPKSAGTPQQQPGAAAPESSKQRTDQRLTPMVRGSWAFTEMFRLNVSYVLTRNLSDKRFDYTRHLGQLGLEARW